MSNMRALAAWPESLCGGIAARATAADRMKRKRIASSPSHQRPHRAQRPLSTAPWPRQRPLEQLKDPPVLVGPRGRLNEAVILHGVHGQLPVLLAQLDQALR